MDVLVRLINSLLMIVIPLGVGMYLVRRWKLGWRLFLIGTGTFIGSQVLHIPFNQFVFPQIMDEFDQISGNDALVLVLYAAALGLSAGIFEEGARYFVYRVWLSDVKHWKEAVLYGAGHGGVEAILLGGLALYAFFQATAYRNANLSELVPAGQLELARVQIDAYWSAPWYAAIMGSVERVFAIIIQISLAVLVFQAAARRKLLWLVVAVGWHAAIDAMAVIGIRSWGVYLTEVTLAILALISLAVLLYLRDKPGIESQDLAEVQEPLPTPGLAPVPRKLDLSKERLDNSRYDNSS